MAQDNTFTVLENLLEKLEEASGMCSKGILRKTEAQSLIETTIQTLDKTLPHDSTTSRIYERLRQDYGGVWRGWDFSDFVSETNCKNIEYWLKVVQKLLNEYDPEFLRSERREKMQYFFQRGDKYWAMKLLYRIMKRAQTSLVVVDEYLDDTIFDYIESLENSVKIQLLTGNKKPIFPNLYHALKTNRPNIEAKENHDCHDRFIVIDSTEVWQLGHSFNGIGDKAFMVNKVKDAQEKDRFLSKLSTWWANGAAI
jgi:hypothetical protein